MDLLEATGPNAENLYATLKNVVTNLDLDGSGKIDLEEFQPVYARLNPLGTQADGRDKFALIDADNDGAISVVELAEHYGFRFASGGDVAGDVDTTGMTDNQLIELMHLNSIASDSAMKRKQAMDAEARAAKLREVQIRLDKDRKLLAMSSVHRLEYRRRNTMMLDLPVNLSKMATEKERVAAASQMLAKRHHATVPETQFLESCALGDIDAIEHALRDGVNPRVSDEKGECGLHKLARLTASATALKAAALLFTNGVDVNYQDRNGKTAAHYAAEYGHVDMLAWLFAKGADSSLAAIDGWTVLHEAAFRGCVFCVRLLLNMHDSPYINARDVHGRTALHIAAYRSSDVAVLQVLVDHGADASLEDTQKLSAKNLAMRVGRQDSFSFLESFDPPKEWNSSSTESSKMSSPKSSFKAGQSAELERPTRASEEVVSRCQKPMDTSERRTNRASADARVPLPAATCGNADPGGNSSSSSLKKAVQVQSEKAGASSGQ